MHCAMLTEAGAAIVGLGRVYGHILSHDALHSDDLWPFPPLDELCLRGLVVDRNGTRFSGGGDEVEGLVTRLARSDDPRGFAAVFDDRALGIGRPRQPIRHGRRESRNSYSAADTS